MQETWRWFGPSDPVSLESILQAGAAGIVTSLYQVPTGEVWAVEEIQKVKNLIESKKLVWSVVESIPVHNDIKSRSGNYQRYIENYIQSIKNVAAAGVNVICYNFMPVVDWTRTSLSYKLPNNSEALRFDLIDFAVYDVFVLERKSAEASYSQEVLELARQRFEEMSESDEVFLLEKNVIAGLPGSYESYSRKSLLDAIEQFIALGEGGLRKNLQMFLQEIIPVAEELGVRMCIHPDDPPFSLFGLPRVVSTITDLEAVFGVLPCAANGLTLCAGSFGARPDNDVVAIAEKFASRVYFVHLRNVKHDTETSFYESDHLDGDVDIFGLVNTLLLEERRRQQEDNDALPIPFRPDHGHLLDVEKDTEGVNPGYSYVGRLKGLAELRGLVYGLESTL